MNRSSGDNVYLNCAAVIITLSKLVHSQARIEGFVEPLVSTIYIHYSTEVVVANLTLCIYVVILHKLSKFASDNYIYCGYTYITFDKNI